MGEVFPYVVSQLYLDSFVFCKKFKIMSEDDNCIVAICEAEDLSAKGDRYDQIYAQFGDSGLVDRNIDNSCTVTQ